MIIEKNSYFHENPNWCIFRTVVLLWLFIKNDLNFFNEF